MHAPPSLDSEISFTVNDKEEKLIKHLWAAINDKNLHSVALQDNRTDDFLTFSQLAMINSDPKQSALKQLKKIYRNYHAGWLCDFVVDFFISQLCAIHNEGIGHKRYWVMPCHETLKIVNKQVSHQTFKHASTAFIQIGQK